MIEIITNSVKETKDYARKFAKTLKPSSVIAYFGSMGMGKTAFTSGIVEGLGGEDMVSSPTFALVNEYELESMLVYHFDMYRVNSMDDLYSTGFFDYLDMGAVLIIEWSENILDALPDDIIKITIDKGEEENQRIIKIEGADDY